MKAWTRRKRQYVGFEGEWLDIGYGACAVCGVHRRLYQPAKRPDVHLCAPCTQRGALAAIPDNDRTDEKEAA